MNFRKRIVSALGAAALIAALISLSITHTGDTGSAPGSLFSRRTTLELWYSDTALTDYLTDAAVAFNESNSDYRVDLHAVEDPDYLDAINTASVKNKDLPDIYIISNDALGRAAQAGLTSVIDDQKHFGNDDIFPKAAKNAVTYDGQYVAYPLYFESAAFLYNKDYLQSMADNLNESLDDAIPSTMVDVINLSNAFDAPENVTDVFKWDVGDIFYNYYFIGNYINVGGDAGDDPNNILIYNQNAIQCLKVYQQLKDYFAIDTDTDDYSDVINDFADGKIAFTVATSDAVKTIRDKAASGDCKISYGVSKLPDFTDDLLTKTMSETHCLVVNGYSEHQDGANQFCQFLLDQNMQDFYDMTGKVSAQAGIHYSDEHVNGFYESYINSVPMTKLRAASNFWMLLENAFSLVWEGDDPNETLRKLTEQMVLEISGTDIKVNKIDDPPALNIASELSESD